MDFKYFLSLTFLTTSVLVSNINYVYSANILFYHHVSSYSHRVVTYPLADALAKKGHQVTFISPFYPHGSYINDNITEIVPKKLAATMNSFLDSSFDINFRVQKTLPRNVYSFYQVGITACDDLLTSSEFQDYLKNTKKLDLIIMDNCITECGQALVHKYRSKVIKFNVVTLVPSEHDIYGITPESSSIPEQELFAPQPPLTFWERVENALISIHFRYVHYTYTLEIDKLIRKHLGYHDMPFVDSSYRDNTSLVLLMGDMITDYTRSLPPMFVHVGGLHCRGKGVKPKELPEELTKFLEGDEESDGFVYISLGTLVVSSTLPEEIKKAFFETIEQFPRLRFLWKWHGPLPEKYPTNLYLGTWFPQNDILAHPKLKAFVMQGGRPSTTEAVCAGVPMIAFPILGDQDSTAQRLNQMGGNIILELGTVRKSELQVALQEVAYGKKMKARMMELKNILEDQPMKPLERAVWWTEYVLRHKDTKHLRPAGFDQWWWQRRLLDVWAFLFMVMVVGLLGIFTGTWLIIRYFFTVVWGRNVKSGVSIKKKYN